MLRTLIHPKFSFGSADDLRWAAGVLESSKIGRSYMIGLGRAAEVERALGVGGECFALLSYQARSDTEFGLQIMLLALAAEVIDDQCYACGRAY